MHSVLLSESGEVVALVPKQRGGETWYSPDSLIDNCGELILRTISTGQISNSKAAWSAVARASTQPPIAFSHKHDGWIIMRNSEWVTLKCT